MEKTAFGTTWWGKRWLDALAGIDYENRIPRGKAYAEEGKVQSFKIDEAQRVVKARVAGTFDPFYAVKLELPAVPQEDVDALVDEMAASPLIVARLAARELSPEIADIAERHGVKIFPESWTDLGMSCSCPDWAVPCKHIAAVIFKLSEEIDANPFILFSLRGIDLAEEMRKRGVSLERAQKAEMPSWRDLIARDDEDLIVQDKDSQGEWVQRLKTLSFAELGEPQKAVGGLFSEAPAGYIHESLKSRMSEMIERAAEAADRRMNPQLEHTVPVMDETKPILSVNTWGQPIVDASVSWFERAEDGIMYAKRIAAPSADNPVGTGLGSLFSGFITSKSLMQERYEVEALYLVWVLAGRLVKAGAIMPQIYSPIEDFFAVRWIPSVVVPEIRELTESVGRAFSHADPGFIRIFGTNGPVKPLLLGELLLGLFIQSFMTEAWRREKLVSGDTVADHEALFGGAPVDVSGDASAQALRLRLEQWTSVTPAPAKSLVEPVLVVHDFRIEGENAIDDKSESLDPAPVQMLDPEIFPESEPLGLGLELRFRLSKQAAGTAESVGLFEILEDPAYANVRFDCMKTISRLAPHCPDLANLLRERAEVQNLTAAEVAPLLFEALPALKLLSVEIVLPRSLKKLLKPEAAAEIDLEKEWQESSGFLGLSTLMEFNWQIALGGRSVSRDEFEVLARQAGKVVRFHDTFVHVTEGEIARIRRALAKRESATKAELLRAALTGNFRGAGVKLGENFERAIKKLFEERPADPPKDLKASLRPYQERGYRWLLKNSRLGMGSILADDMGLGKTLQVIALLEKLREDGELERKQALVVVPTTLLTNWLREAKKFAPKLEVSLFYGPQRNLAAASGDVILTSYGNLRSSIKELAEQQFRIVVIDEAQAIKNYKTSGFKAVRQIKTDSFIAMSGTPVENSLMEYWAVMEASNPGLLGSPTSFRKDFALPIENLHSREIAEQFRRLTSPFILRRLKSDKAIIEDLPEKVTANTYCTLSKVQAALYDRAVKQAMARIESESNNFNRRALVVQLILKLKQICNAPAQFEPSAGYRDPATSGKMERLFEILEEMKEAGRKVLIFTQFVSMGQILQTWIGERTGKTPQFLYGGLTVKDRQDMVDRFEARRDESVMILSLKAAGTGLNLTSASVVIHYDLWWNPAVENQATDRAYRIGQKNTVNVYRFICANTFEEKINEMIDSKRALADMTVATGESWIGDLSNEELEEVFSLSEN